MDEEQEELSTHEASQKSGMSQGYLASLLRQHKLEGAYDSKRRRWTVNAAALERFLTIDDKTGERRITYAKRLQQRAQQAVQEGRLAQAEPLYLKALTFFDYFYCSESKCKSFCFILEVGLDRVAIDITNFDIFPYPKMERNRDYSIPMR